jgi:dipeptidyl aminopeptidase/acylaminoacyl peptidase
VGGQASVLILQGRNDTRTRARPVEMYEAKLKALGKSIEVHWFDAEHLSSFAQVEQPIEHYERMLRFVCRVLR